MSVLMRSRNWNKRLIIFSRIWCLMKILIRKYEKRIRIKHKKKWRIEQLID